MIIKNGLVWEESGSFLTKDLHIDSDTHRIAMDSADTADDTIIDASGLYVIPGLVDIHIHGAMGCDFSDGSAEGLLKIAKYLRSCGGLGNSKKAGGILADLPGNPNECTTESQEEGLFVAGKPKIGAADFVYAFQR